MKIPTTLPVTAEQSRASRFQLGLTQANVIEESSLPGHKLKNFETGRFVPDMPFLEALRDYYSSKGIDFTATVSVTNQNQNQPSSAATQTVASGSPISFFPVSPNIPEEVVFSTWKTIESIDNKLFGLLTSAAQRDSGFFGTGEFKEETLAVFRESFLLLAVNYLLSRAVSGWPEIGVTAGDMNISENSVLAGIFKEVAPYFEQAGLLAKPAQAPESDSESDKVEA